MEHAYLENWLNGMDSGKMVYDSNEKEAFYVTELNANVVGCGGYYIPKTDKKAKMTWGMVDSLHHKKGIGKLLLEFRIKIIEEQFPSHSIELDTSQHTFPFFEKLGFHVTKITENGYGTGLHRYDMIRKTC
ncbi:MAG: family N-acetyltransferase [Bacteroidetes bacterium]|nr:family N-acetyltransferase [Bacteroidota bacterium]